MPCFTRRRKLLFTLLPAIRQIVLPHCHSYSTRKAAFYLLGLCPLSCVCLGNGPLGVFFEQVINRFNQQRLCRHIPIKSKLPQLFVCGGIEGSGHFLFPGACGGIKARGTGRALLRRFWLAWRSLTVMHHLAARRAWPLRAFFLQGSVVSASLMPSFAALPTCHFALLLAKRQSG